MPKTATTGYYRIRFAADPVQLIFFRAGLNAWLRGLRWPEPERIDAVLAISEGCTNSVQHAYPTGEPGHVDITGRPVVGETARRIIVAVRDEGRWRSRAGGPIREHRGSTRRRQLRARPGSRLLPGTDWCRAPAPEALK